MLAKQATLFLEQYLQSILVMGIGKLFAQAGLKLQSSHSQLPN
jgi:hypothetical protein